MIQLYEDLNNILLQDKHESIITTMITKFLEKYKNNINSKNFAQFKEDTYIVVEGLNIFMFQEDINNDDDVSEEQVEIFLDIKNNVEYIINNIQELQYEEDDEDNPIFNSINIVVNFIKERT